MLGSRCDALKFVFSLLTFSLLATHPFDGHARLTHRGNGKVTTIKKVRSLGVMNGELLVNGRPVGLLTGFGRSEAARAHRVLQSRRNGGTLQIAKDGGYVRGVAMVPSASEKPLLKAIGKINHRRGQESYELPGVKRISVVSGSPLPTLEVNGRPVGTLHGSGPNTARLAQEILKSRRHKPSTVQVKVRDGTWVESVAVPPTAGERKLVRAVDALRAQRRGEWQQTEHVLPGVKQVKIVSGGTLPTLVVNGREVGSLHGYGGDQARLARHILQTSKSPQTLRVIVRGGGYVEGVSVVE
jgi:hypothetical protein